MALQLLLGSSDSENDFEFCITSVIRSDLNSSRENIDGRKKVNEEVG